MLQRLTILAVFLIPVYAHGYFVESDVSSAEVSSGRVAFTVNAATTTIPVDGLYDETLSFTIADESTRAVASQLTVVDDEVCGAYEIDGGENASFDGAHTVSVTGSASLPCSFTLQAEAWQPELGYGGGGFTASSSITFTLIDEDDASPIETVVLNEVYPHHNTASSSPLDREWVELYNGTENDIDVLGWKISEIAGSSEKAYTISSECNSASACMEPMTGTSTEVAAGGYLLIQFKDGSSGKLNNDGDTVRLYNPEDVLLDMFTYDTSKGIGLSWARIPDGGTWVDPVPTPGGVNAATIQQLKESGLTDQEIKEIPRVHIREEDVHNEAPDVKVLQDTPDEPSVVQDDEDKATSTKDLETEDILEDMPSSATTTTHEEAVEVNRNPAVTEGEKEEDVQQDEEQNTVEEKETQPDNIERRSDALETTGPDTPLIDDTEASPPEGDVHENADLKDTNDSANINTPNKAEEESDVVSKKSDI